MAQIRGASDNCDSPVEHVGSSAADSPVGTDLVALDVGVVSSRELETWSLVLLAASIPHTVVNLAGELQIMVGTGDFERASYELASYEAENKFWPPVAPAPPHNYQSLIPVFLGLSLLVFYRYSGSWSDNAYFTNGALHGRKLLFDHEWWRLITALTLHADINHVLGNVMVGGLIIGLLGMETGYGVALFLTLIAGAAGNLVNVWFHGVLYRGIGFSTAVFGAIGILCGLRLYKRGALKDFLLPIGAGGGLLAMLGTGGERTDLGAHIWGLVLGGIIGLLLARNSAKLPKVFHNLLYQRLFILLAVALVALAWHAAFNSP